MLDQSKTILFVELNMESFVPSRSAGREVGERGVPLGPSSGSEISESGWDCRTLQSLLHRSTNTQHNGKC